MTASVSPADIEADDRIPTVVDAWLDANQRYLTAALARVVVLLNRHTGRTEPEAVPEVLPALSRPASLDVVCEAFGLTSFERDVLMLCAGVELDGSVPGLIATATPGVTSPTFGLALAVLPGAHWSAITPEGPLRHWRLIELAGPGPLTTAPLRIDERALHFLTGLVGPDPKLTGIVSRADDAVPITPGQQSVSHVVADLWQAGDGPMPVLNGADRHSRTAVAAHAARDLGLRLSAIDPAAFPTDPAAREDLARLLERESVLAATAFVLDCDDGSWTGLDTVCRSSRARMVVSAPQPPRLPRTGAVVLDVPRPTAAEQRDLWRQRVGPDAPVESLVAAFDLGAASIGAAATVAAGEDGALWSACRALDRPDLAKHAQRVQSTATWDDLVLPAPQRQTLSLLAAHARHRVTVYDDWGLSLGRQTGLGSTAIFGGPSGTGKSFAAEVIAGDLGLDLYRVDLSAVVSKYIGETEKNLRQVFDAADHGAAVLLFDEADALFGKRTEVRDSHDRYANVEVSYLLQRMEAYRGVAILTTNMADSIDAAFQRRVRFIVTFPFPDQAMQKELWRRAFPASTPTDGLDFNVLSTLDLSGGTIRNVAVNAAVLAADAGEPVRMSHVVHAARIESAKLGQPMASLRGEAGRT